MSSEVAKFGSGVGTVSGFIQIQALPVSLWGRSGNGITDYSGSINVNISGGVITVSPFGLQSGTMVIISGGPAGLSGLNVTTTVTTTIPGYQSGSLMGISGGQLALSGLNVVTTVNPFGLNSGSQMLVSGGQLALSGLNVITTVNPFGLQSGSMMLISGGQLALSGGNVVLSGGAGSPNISGSVRVSGTVEVSGAVGLQIRNSGNVWSDVGHASGLVNYAVPVSSGGILPTLPFGLQSGSFVLVSGGQLALSGLQVIISGGAGSSFISGSVQVSGTVGVSGVIQNLQSGTISLLEMPTYGLNSQWSGAAGKHIIAIRHGGGTAGQSGLEIVVTRIDIAIWASGNINRFDVLLTSGLVSGTAPAITAFIRHRFANAASVASGFVD